jgi:hypothetical protein
VATLRDLQATANRQHVSTGQSVSAPLTWQALNHIITKSGNPEVGYDEFAARWDSEPMLKQLVARFDGQGLVIKTKGMDSDPTQGEPKTNGVEQMAKAATKRAFS